MRWTVFKRSNEDADPLHLPPEIRRRGKEVLTGLRSLGPELSTRCGPGLPGGGIA